MKITYLIPVIIIVSIGVLYSFKNNPKEKPDNYFLEEMLQGATINSLDAGNKLEIFNVNGKQAIQPQYQFIDGICIINTGSLLQAPEFSESADSIKEAKSYLKLKPNFKFNNGMGVID